MRPTLPRLFAALPDAITAGVFATTWTAPAVTGIESVARLSQVMLMEFIVIHSSVFYALIAAAGAVARGRRLAWLAALSSVYLLFVLGFAIGERSTWPLFAFAWLFVSRFAHLWTRPVQSDAESGRMVRLWAVSVAAYLFGAFVTVTLPLPRLGITAEVVRSLQLTGSGEWDTRPESVLAFGTLYFALQAWAKYLMAAPAPAPRDGAAADMLGQRVARIAGLATQQTPKS